MAAYAFTFSNIDGSSSRVTGATAGDQLLLTEGLALDFPER